MHHIRLLENRSAITAEQILANLSSVIKELLDNSIDAGATKIRVCIENNGLERITVVDNGHGMNFDDLRCCAGFHYTSKLRNISDLATVQTLGFRGEGLAAIAEMSKEVVIHSSVGTPESTNLKIVCSEGAREYEPVRLENVHESHPGTTVSVVGLFERNQKVRFNKFKKNARSQAADAVSNVFEYAVVFAESIHFFVSLNNRIVLDTSDCNNVPQVVSKLNMWAESEFRKYAHHIEVKSEKYDIDAYFSSHGLLTTPRSAKLGFSATQKHENSYANEKKFEGGMKARSIIKNCVFSINNRPATITPLLANAFDGLYRQVTSKGCGLCVLRISIHGEGASQIDFNRCASKRQIIFPYEKEIAQFLDSEIHRCHEEELAGVSNGVDNLPDLKFRNIEPTGLSQSCLTDHQHNPIKRLKVEANPLLVCRHEIPVTGDTAEPPQKTSVDISGTCCSFSQMNVLDRIEHSELTSSETTLCDPAFGDLTNADKCEMREIARIPASDCDEAFNQSNNVRLLLVETQPDNTLQSPLLDEIIRPIEDLRNPADGEPAKDLLGDPGSCRNLDSDKHLSYPEYSNYRNKNSSNDIDIQLHKSGGAAAGEGMLSLSQGSSTFNTQTASIPNPFDKPLQFASDSNEESVSCLPMTSCESLTEEPGVHQSKNCLTSDLQSPARSCDNRSPSDGSSLTYNISGMVTPLLSDISTKVRIRYINSTLQAPVPCYSDSLQHDSIHIHEMNASVASQPESVASDPKNMCIVSRLPCSDDTNSQPGVNSDRTLDRIRECVAYDHDHSRNRADSNDTTQHQALVSNTLQPATLRIVNSISQSLCGVLNRIGQKHTLSTEVPADAQLDDDGNLKFLDLHNVVKTEVMVDSLEFRNLKDSRSPPRDGTAAPKSVGSEQSSKHALFAQMHVIGIYRTSFILARHPSGLYIIDQHAADEKAKFEEINNTAKFGIQPLTVPKQLRLGAEQTVRLSLAAETNLLAHNGYEVKFLGGEYYLTAIPLFKGIPLTEVDLMDLLSFVDIGDFDSTDQVGKEIWSFARHNGIARPPRVWNIMAMRACKSAIRFGEKISILHAERIVKRMGSLDHPWNCPHGRPTFKKVNCL